MRRQIIALTLLAAAVTLSGCRYMGNRAADLADIITAEATIGPGIEAHLQATTILGTSLGTSKQSGPMMHGRFVGMGSRESGGILISGGTDVEDDLMRPVYGDEEYKPRSRSWFLFLRWPFMRPLIRRREWPQTLDVELGGSLLIVGAHVGLSPIEAVDFLLGFTTLDICGDDYGPEPEEAPPAPVAHNAVPEQPPAGDAEAPAEESDDE